MRRRNGEKIKEGFERPLMKPSELAAKENGRLCLLFRDPPRGVAAM